MNRIAILAGCGLLAAGLCLVSPSLRAAITPEQRKEINQVGNEVPGAAKMIREKKYDEAGKHLDELTAKLEKIAKDAELKPGDKVLAPIYSLIEKQRQALTKASGGKVKPDVEEVSFVKQVGPLLQSKCVSCHGENAAGKLRLDSFAEMKKGGKSGLLLQLGNPQRSLIMARVAAPLPAQRMPKDGEPLAKEELELLANWIKQGAKFDGEDETVKLADIGKAPKKVNTAPVKIAKATGGEKVKFIKDLAPDFVSICQRCHSGNNPRGGFRTVTFEDLMRGGDSGAVLVAGNLDGSRLWELINGGPPKMPPGQARIHKEWYQKLETWIKEGCKYDGDDPKIPLQRLVPTEEELKLKKLGLMTFDEFLAARKEQTQEQWKRALSKEESQEHENADFLMIGNVGAERLKQIAGWADEHAKALRATFKLSAEPIWKGKLAVVVYKDRFGYSEFSQTINNREPDPAIVGHSIVTLGHEEAYICLQDVGDSANSTLPDMRLNLIDQMTGAFLKRDAKPLPEWVIRGTGLAMATKEVGGDNEYLRGLRVGAADAVRGLEKPDDLFNDGKFSPTDMAPIGYTLVSFMIKEAGVPKFANFIDALRTGNDLKTAVGNAYKPATTQALAIGYLSSIGSSPAAAKKKKK